MRGWKETLLRVMDRKDHWAWPVFGGPNVTLGQLKKHFRQEFAVYVRDFPVFLGRIHSRCPVPEVRRDLAENLYEEETGGLSGTGPHAELFLYMMEGLGYRRAEFVEIPLLPESRAYRAWLDEATLEHPWIVGAAVTTIFVEGSVHDRRDISRPAGRPGFREEALVDLARENSLVRHHGLDPRYLELKRAHARVEDSHRRSAWSIVLKHARSAADRKRVLEALEKSLDLWNRYRDGVARAARIRMSPRQDRLRRTS